MSKASIVSCLTFLVTRVPAGCKCSTSSILEPIDRSNVLGVLAVDDGCEPGWLLEGILGVPSVGFAPSEGPSESLELVEDEPLELLEVLPELLVEPSDDVLPVLALLPVLGVLSDSSLLEAVSLELPVLVRGWSFDSPCSSSCCCWCAVWLSVMCELRGGSSWCADVVASWSKGPVTVCS